MRIVVPRDARDHGYLALKVDGGGFGLLRQARVRTRRRRPGLRRVTLELVRWWCSRRRGAAGSAGPRPGARPAAGLRSRGLPRAAARQRRALAGRAAGPGGSRGLGRRWRAARPGPGPLAGLERAADPERAAGPGGRCGWLEAAVGAGRRGGPGRAAGRLGGQLGSWGTAGWGTAGWGAAGADGSGRRISRRGWVAGASTRHSQAPGAGAGTPGAGGDGGPASGGPAAAAGLGRERGRAALDVRLALGLALGRALGREGEATPPRRRSGVGRLGLDRLDRQRLLGGQVTRAGRRGLLRGGGPGRGSGDRGLPRRNLGFGLSGRDVRARRRRPGQFGSGRLGLTEQLIPLDERTSAQGQQGYAANADRDVDQHQLAGDNPGDQQSERDGDQERAEPDHRRSPSEPRRSSAPAPTGARARALPQRYGSHRNGARPQQACRTGRGPGRHCGRPPVRSTRPASAAASPLRRSGSHRSP